MFSWKNFEIHTFPYEILHKHIFINYVLNEKRQDKKHENSSSMQHNYTKATWSITKQKLTWLFLTHVLLYMIYLSTQVLIYTSIYPSTQVLIYTSICHGCSLFGSRSSAPPSSLCSCCAALGWWRWHSSMRCIRSRASSLAGCKCQGLLQQQLLRWQLS